MKEHFMKNKTKQLETAAAAPEAAGPAKLGGQRREEWLAIRKKAGRKINPATAEIMWKYGYAFDVYEIGSGPFLDFQQLQRNYFARSPGSDIWVFLYDLPTATRHALWKKHGAKLTFRLQDEEIRALQRQQHEKIKIAEHWWDWVDSGKSFQELAIMVDIYAAGGRLSEQGRKMAHETFKLIRRVLELGSSRQETMAYIKSLTDTTIHELTPE
jgi:hypothetical protein